MNPIIPRKYKTIHPLRVSHKISLESLHLQYLLTDPEKISLQAAALIDN